MCCFARLHRQNGTVAKTSLQYWFLGPKPARRVRTNNAFAKSDCPSVARRKDEGDDVHGLGLFAGAMLAMAGFIGFALRQ
jgi:hypothetical protein